MTQNVYVAGAEQGSGKSAIVLAMMELLSGSTGKVGFFRPVTPSGGPPDYLIHLISQHYQLDFAYESMYGCTGEQALSLIAGNRYGELIKRILEKYKALEAQCDRVLCAGTDYARGHFALEFDFNTDVANNLGCAMIPVVLGQGRDLEQIKDATTSLQRSLQGRGCQLLATVVNVVAHDQVDALRRCFNQLPWSETPVYVVPAEMTLSQPTIADIARSLDAKLLNGEPQTLNREVSGFKVAAMHVRHFLEHIEKDDLIIVPGDRSDIILASLMSYPSTAYPQISGLLLTGDQQPAAQVKRLIDGLGSPPVALLGVASDTFTTATKVSRVRAKLAPENKRKIAAALGVVESGIDLSELESRLVSGRNLRVTPLMFEHELVQRAKSRKQRIVLPEGAEERIMQAAEILTLRGVAELTLLGNADEIGQKAEALGLHLNDIQIIDPLQAGLRQQYAETYFDLRQHKGISRDMAYDAMADVSYFGTMMVHHGQADGMVSGAVHTTQHTIRPAFEIIKTRPGTSIVSSVFLMCLEDRVLVYGDCAVNPDPDAEQLADIAVSSADTASMFGIEPRVAMLSYSTGESGKGKAVDKVREATAIARTLRPELKIEGPIQYDAAVDAGVARSKLPGSEVAGNATVFIFPDLNTGNNTYKAVQRSANAIAIGPVLQGLKKPVNDLSRGCSVTDIVNTVAITAIQAQEYGGGA